MGAWSWPGEFLLIDGGEGPADLAFLTGGEVGERWEGAQDVPDSVRAHTPVAVNRAGRRWWRAHAGGEEAADLAELAGIVLPATPFRPGELARALDVPGETGGSVFWARVLAALWRRLGEMDTALLQQLAGLLRTGASPWAGPAAALADACARVFRDAAAPAREVPWRGRRPSGEEKGDVDPEAALAWLSGPVGGCLNGFARRPQQEEMVRATAAALNGDLCLLLEGATGTGKSLAYLLPSLLWAGGGRRVLVATHTINLQEQLVKKDLPLLKDAGLPFTAALVKGRANYLCLLRWQAVLREEVTAAEAALFARLLVWSRTTGSGDRGELGLEAEGAEAWRRVQADSDGCAGAACPHWNSDCFVTLARQAAEEADLLVANHSLLFSDILAEGRVLPEYSALVIDEAHHLEDGACEFLGRRLSLRSLLLLCAAGERTLSRLGTLPAMQSSLWRPALQRCLGSLAAGRKTTLAFFDRLAQTVWTDPEDRPPFRLGPGALAVLDGECRNLARLWEEGAHGMDALTGGLAEGGEAWAVLAADLGRLVAQWRQAAADLTAVWGAADSGQVYWVEAEGFGAALRAAPVEVAAILAEKLLSTIRPVILSSATLTVNNRNGGFDHFAERTGVALLPPERVAFCRVASPFDYPSQALFAVAAGMPGQEGEDYPQALAGAVGTLARAAGGRTMVLFTSHRTLRAVYRVLKEPLEREGFRLLGHGIDNSRSRLVDEFRAAEKAVLFGAASFWEGVDIPGEALSLVVIVKLPFVPPGDPVQEARLEALARRRLDGFSHLSVPQAVIRFKQGFGRLIRSTADRGAVVVLDSRLVTRSYGARFLASLPVSPRVGDVGSLAAHVAGWLGGKDRFTQGEGK